jgi:hypothetical protein
MTPTATLTATTILPENTPKKTFFGRLTSPSPNTFFLLCFAFFLLWKITWCLFWGVDLGDTGLHLHSYQQVFKNPGAVGYTFLYWFTNVVGGTWLALFPDSGLLGIRFFGLLIESATFLLTYNLLKNVFNPRAVAVGLVLVSFRLTFGIAHFCYNLFTVFLTVLAVFFLMRGLLKNNLPALFLAGVILALNTFARLSSVSLFLLCGLMLLAAFLQHKSQGETVKKVCFVGVGAIAGVIAVFTLMTALGHAETFANAVATAREVSASAESSYATHELLRYYWKNFLDISLAGTIALFTWLALAVLTPKNKFLFTITNIICFVVFLFALRLGYFINWFAIYGFYPIAILVCATYSITMLWKKFSGKIFELPRVQMEKTLLSTAAIAMILLIPLGSNWGIYSVRGNFEILAFPLACALIWDFAKKHRDKKIAIFGQKIPYSVPQITIILFIIAFAIINTKRRSTTFFNDPGSVFSKTCVIDNKRIRYIRTSERMARNINDVLTELRRHALSNASLMSYETVPLLNFLTETDSYVKNSYVWVYTAKILGRELRVSEIKAAQLPVIITQKLHTTIVAEDTLLYPNFFSQDARWDDRYGAKKRYFVFKHFMDKHKYERHWGNEFFDVWLPKKGGAL